MGEITQWGSNRIIMIVKGLCSLVGLTIIMMIVIGRHKREVKWWNMVIIDISVLQIVVSFL